MSASEPFRPLHFLHPRHWPVWLGLGVVRLLSQLPYRQQLSLGKGLGDLMYWLVPSRRQIVQANLRLCFPKLTDGERKALARDTFRSAAISVFENALSWWGDDRRMRGLYRIEGLEHYEAARAAGKGIILLGGHYTTLEISGRFLAFHVDGLRPIYKPAKNPFYQAVMSSMRQRRFDGLLRNSDMRGIVNDVRRGKVVWYAPDQDFGRKRSVFAPFFGVPTATLTTTARLAKLTGAPVLPYYSQRLPGGEGYLIRLLPPLEGFPSGDDVADAAHVNAVIEQQVRAAPEQYLWLHRRFKTRPIGEASLYG